MSEMADRIAFVPAVPIISLVFVLLVRLQYGGDLGGRVDARSGCKHRAYAEVVCSLCTSRQSFFRRCDCHADNGIFPKQFSGSCEIWGISETVNTAAGGHSPRSS